MTVKKLLLMAGLHGLVMFVLTYVMVATWGHVYLNINKFYMAAIMTAPMVIIEGLLMGSMYENKRGLYMLMGASGFAVLLLFVFIRWQIPVGDKAFLRSMIPHHSSAILMCNQADIRDQEIKDLCDEIVEAQRSEIKQMQQIMERLNFTR